MYPATKILLRKNQKFSPVNQIIQIAIVFFIIKGHIV